MKIVCAEDCGNAPKKQLLRDLHINYWQGDDQMMIDNLTDDAVLKVVGAEPITGKDAIVEYLKAFRMNDPQQLTIHHIITHGNTAAANATIFMRNNQQIDYCHVYKFGSFGKKAKIKEITSYVIDTHKE